MIEYFCVRGMYVGECFTFIERSYSAGDAAFFLLLFDEDSSSFVSRLVPETGSRCKRDRL